MFILTENAVLVCTHELGRVNIPPTQALVMIDNRRVLVQADPEGKSITGCPNIGATIKPCQMTLAVKAGYSTFVFIEGRSICLDTVTGQTDGTPPGVVTYKVRSPGQDLVQELS
jgi:hypothetical protein